MDRNGWGGVNQFNPVTGKFTRHAKAFSKPGDLYVYEVYVDSRGIIWIGTDGRGFYQYDPRRGKWSTYATGSAAFLEDDVQEIEETAAGELWLGTWQGGLYYFNRLQLSIRAQSKIARLSY